MIETKKIIEFISKKSLYDDVLNSFRTSLCIRLPNDTVLDFRYVFAMENHYFSDNGRTFNYVHSKLSKYDDFKSVLEVKRFLENVINGSCLIYEFDEIMINISHCDDDEELNDAICTLISKVEYICQYTKDYVKEHYGDDIEDVFVNENPLFFDSDWDDIFESISNEQKENEEEQIIVDTRLENENLFVDENIHIEKAEENPIETIEDNLPYSIVLESYEINEEVATHIIKKYTKLTKKQIAKALKKMPSVLLENVNYKEALDLSLRMKKGRVYTKITPTEN